MMCSRMMQIPSRIEYSTKCGANKTNKTLDFRNKQYIDCCCRIQVFHCLKHEGSGGRTLLVDGFYAAEKLRQQSPENFELLARVPIGHEYIENTDGHRNHMTGIGPLLNVYPWNNEMYLIRYV